MADIFKFYGLDWLAMGLSVVAMGLLGNRIKWGFVAFLGANVSWLLLGTLILHSPAIILGNTLFLIANTKGFIKWNAPAASHERKSI
jgi:hypothetical protein